MDEAALIKVLDALRGEQSDNRQFEVKAAANGFPLSVAKTICAFANMPGGGTIILGVDERRDFAVSGVYDAKNCMQTLANYVQKEYTVPIFADISSVVIEGKSVVISNIHEAKNHLKPIRYKKTNTSFIRQYDSDFELSNLEERLFESNKGIVYYDDEPVPNTSIADLNKELVDGYIVNRKRHSEVLTGFNDNDILLRTGILSHSGEISMAGLLALGTYPQQFYPNYTIKASIRSKIKTSEIARAVNVKSFDGSIPYILESTLRWIMSNSDEYTMDLGDGNVGRVGAFPSVTCRELIANTLIHRDLSPLSLIETISVIIEDDRLIISNPGGLFGISVRELGRSASRTRNTRLADICQYVPAERGANIIEKLGSGIPKVFAEQDRYKFRRPQFIDGEIYFTTVLYKGYPERKQPGVPPRNRNATLVLNALSDIALSRVEIEKRTMLTTAQVRYALSKLMEKGLVTRIGDERDPKSTYMANIED